MRVLCVGDVFAPIGTEALVCDLGRIKRNNGIDLCIVNGENSATGNGINRQSAEMIFAAGADIITGGNHTLKNKEFYPYLDENPCVLRPDNIKSNAGGGYLLYDMGKYTAAVINLSGKVFLDSADTENPFTAANTLVKKAKNEGADFIFVDFHAEATSEKRALGLYLDGKISAFFGTHTHVQTADNQVLPLGTGYITDLGMTGATQSVLGVKSNIIIDRFLGDTTQKFEPAEGETHICGCIFDIDEKTGLCKDTERICEVQKGKKI